jgi:hypothetical protein
VVSFTHQPLYPQGNSPRYLLDRRLGGPQSRSGRGGEEKNSQPSQILGYAAENVEILHIGLRRHNRVYSRGCSRWASTSYVHIEM